MAPRPAPALNARLDRSGRAHIDAVLVRSLDEVVPKTAATALFNKWEIGRKATNNGLLMLLALDQRRVEFETGYGLEADPPDITCYRIQQRYMLAPACAGDYDGAAQAAPAP